MDGHHGFSRVVVLGLPISGFDRIALFAPQTTQGALSISTSQRIGVDGYVFDFDTLLWPALLVHVHLFNIIQDIVPLDDLAKNSVLSIQVGSGGEGDEELAPVGIGTLVRHAHDTSRIVSQRRTYLIFEELGGGIIDGRRGLRLGIRGGAASLDHEVGDQAVEGTAIVEGRGAEGEEVLGCLGDRLAEDLNLDVAFGSVQLRVVSASAT